MFPHGHGLGVLAFGEEPPSALQPLLKATSEERARIAALYFALGRGITVEARMRELQKVAEQIGEYDALALKQKTRLEEYDAFCRGVRVHMEEYDALCRGLQSDLARERQAAATLRGLLADARSRAESAEAAVADMASSRIVRAVRAVRGVGERLKRIARTSVKGND
jgi:septal ring factor EnvC (AmiA/AmiB activator)